MKVDGHGHGAGRRGGAKYCTRHDTNRCIHMIKKAILNHSGGHDRIFIFFNEATVYGHGEFDAHRIDS